MTSTEQWEGIWGHLPLGFGPYQHPAPFDEGDIASLPDWQQELLSDTDWNKPYIPPRDDGESDTQSTP